MRKGLFLVLLLSIISWSKSTKDKIHLTSGSFIVGEIIQIDSSGNYHIQLEHGGFQTLKAKEVSHVSKVEVKQKGYHQHDGFHLSMGLGFSSGSTNLKFSNGNEAEYSGLATLAMIQLGWSLNKNVVMYLNSTGHVTTDPEVKTGGVTFSSTNFDFTESNVGLGARYYFPTNLFVDAMIGVSTFMEEGVVTAETNNGFHWNTKIGKEWWISDNWGLGFLAQTGYSTAEDEFSTIVDRLHFGIAFSATYN